ncbi:bifunctional 4-hydroxy-2-oxoglutarate aldolase/2-dehydro-3-deoxy-phosphogluconate aldolase [Qipengyuania spongiae]|uniref:Bifunctional 4-hydroxy-2-oxoglutarate aldolase/2-dehydro-3-deoxy-phosphogluconate aldolase n=1 Tax=Qipengyuania spongiae TaxID=2909673 RepID=A0ABY5SY71_9SPHN|nr:bifunctional 4-hydroxy-2-oxoglutarate aldolase/2-dehydro-3-deoxy-phosphogluconate aldolase [Qipengyuania spongiae]UVI39492.1 bifunctional 4-hydroxy-2-oxoglutarate aldolase/2-dehydro-3-deoxy-phosphogluconate aldolase [Qipengyuania spongiae]
MTTHAQISSQLERAPIVPLVSGDDPDTAVRTAEALRDGGLGVIEVVLRSAGAQRCMEAIVERVEGVIVGAGTVLALDQARSVEASGAQFVVCPGLVDAIAEHCLARDMPCFPGTVTAGEVQRAHAIGLRVVKFFPASLAGGIPMLKAFGSVFRDMRFMPTGGISPDNLGEFLALPQVLACGGSWLTPDDAIAAGDYAKITRLAEQAVTIARQVR